MLVHKITKGIEQRDDSPNSFFLTYASPEDYYIIEDGTTLAMRILKYHPYFDFLLDEDQNLVDILIDEERYNLQEEKQEKIERIKELKQNLKVTDYHAIKYSEGRLSEEEYAPMGEQRQLWRDEINALEAEVMELNV